MEDFEPSASPRMEISYMMKTTSPCKSGKPNPSKMTIIASEASLSIATRSLYKKRHSLLAGDTN